jgi:DNA topoisomerase I
VIREKPKSQTPVKTRAKKATPVKKQETESDSEEEEEVTKKKTPAKKNSKIETESEEEEEESEEEVKPKKTPVKKRATPAKKATKIEPSEEEESESEDIFEPSDFEEDKKKKKTPAKKTPAKRTPAKKTPVKKEESESEFESESEEETKKKTPAKKTPVKKTPTKKAKKEEEESTKKTPVKGKAKKEEEEEEIYKWWEDENATKGARRGEKKWKTLTHNGVIFPPPYEPHGVPILYDKKKIALTPEQEEIATMYAVLKNNDSYNDKTFQSNFFNDWKKSLGPKSPIKTLEKCDFSPIWEWYLKEKEKKNNLSKEEKEKLKKEKEELEKDYLYCTMDGRKEKIGNFRIEPPGLFKGRGEHPKRGCLKSRITPEEVTINVGDKKNAPKPPKGHHWKEVISDNKVSWLATWKNNVDGGTKYVMLAASSSLKGKSDLMKYENARELKEKMFNFISSY